MLIGYLVGDKLKKCVEKVAVFDLDGTLYHKNSHIEILNYYYNTSFFTSILFRIFSFFCPNLHLKIMDMFYSHIPDNIKNGYILDFNDEILHFFYEYRRKGYETLIISNAPYELVKNAAQKLETSFLKSTSSCKAKILLENYQFNKLFVCTDNKSDIDILSLADESLIIAKNKDRKYYEKVLQGHMYSFI